MMMRRVILAAVLAFVPALASAQTAGGKNPADQRAAVKALAQRVDALIAKPWAEAGIKPAPPATDGELCRRLYLDLIGKIPSVIDVRDFINDLNQYGWGRLRALTAEERF